MAVYSVFKALGLEIVVRPIFDLENNYEFQDRRENESDAGSDEESDNIDVSTKNNLEEGTKKSFVGNALGKVITTEAGGFEESNEEILQAAGGRWLNVKWLTKPKSREVSFVHLTVS